MNLVPKHYWDRELKCSDCAETFLADSTTHLPEYLEYDIPETQMKQAEAVQSPDPNRPAPPGISRFYYTVDGQTVEGPINGDELLLSVTHDEIPAVVRVCKEGTDDWIEFSDIPDSEFTPRGIAKMHEDLPEVIEKKSLEEAERIGQEIGSNPIVGIGCAILLAIIIFVLWSVFS